MGGRALKNAFTRRYQRAEFDQISKELLEKLNRDFPRAAMPLFYRKKESFGDADILVQHGWVFADDATGGKLVSDPRFPMRTYIETQFKPTEIFHNGSCWSFDYKELQIDLITASEEDFDTNLMYLSYNDLGNYIGRIAQGFGLKYGQEGLWYEHYFKNQNIGSIPVSKDYPRIFEFLGLDYERYQEGFDTLEEIFSYIAYSRYFNWEAYQLSSLNKINRDRNAKRSSYMSFLGWIGQNVMDDFHKYIFEEDKTSYCIQIDEAFPDAKIVKGIRKLEYEHCKKLYIKSKFSGSDVMDKYGFQGKELGDAMSGFKKFIEASYRQDGDSSELYEYDDFILGCDEKFIYEHFDAYLDYINNFKSRMVDGQGTKI